MITGAKVADFYEINKFFYMFKNMFRDNLHRYYK